MMEQQLLSGFQNQFGEYSLVLGRAGTEEFTVYGGKKRLRTRLRKSSCRLGKVQTTGLFDTACKDFPV